MLATFASAAHGDQALTPLDNVLLIAAKPDNIPILVMLLLVGYFTYTSLRDARKHDRLIAEGRKKDVLKAMQD
jgi:hypothetical protein